jgi:hypothetical protein
MARSWHANDLKRAAKSAVGSRVIGTRQWRVMGIFKNKKKSKHQVAGEQRPQDFAHSSGSNLEDLVEQHTPSEDDLKRPRGRAARLHPDDDPNSD